MGDSLLIYQCHVDQQPADSGKTVKARTITDKYVLCKTGQGLLLRRYGCHLYTIPNKRFSGLKIREKEYWQFFYKEEKQLSEKEFEALLALEQKGKEAIEYDYPVSRYTTNQVIFKNGPDFRQLVYDRAWLLSSLFK